MFVMTAFPELVFIKLKRVSHTTGPRFCATSSSRTSFCSGSLQEAMDSFSRGQTEGRLAEEELKQEGVEVHLEKLQLQKVARTTPVRPVSWVTEERRSIRAAPFRQKPMAPSMAKDPGVPPQLAVHHSQHP